MGLTRLILREIAYRKLNCALGVLSVGVAVACLVAALAILQKHDARTEQVVAAKEIETREKMAQLEDDYRKITKGLGFNVLILPRQQNLSDLFAQDYATHYMPETYVSVWPPRASPPSSTSCPASSTSSSGRSRNAPSSSAACAAKCRSCTPIPRSPSSKPCRQAR